MQQAIYTSLSQTMTAVRTAQTNPARKTTLRRHLALQWDLYGVVALLASCTAYGVLVLGQVA